MAQAEMALDGMALASPLPTTPPSPLELARRILPRQFTSETCGWVDANILSPVACPLGYVCAHNTNPAYNAAFCCDALSFPNNCPFATTCLDSTAVAESCTGLCLQNTAVNKCTSAGSAFCDKKIYSYSTISTLITEWGCSPAPGTYSVYDAYILQTAGASPTTTVAPVISNGIAGASPAGGGSSPGVSKNTPTVGPVVTPTPSPSTTSASSSKGLGGGAIAGIVVGAIFVILFGLGMILLYRFITRRSRERRQQQQLQQQQQNEAFQQGGMTQHHRPSNITMPSTTPLVLPATSELSPADSASQIGGYSSTISSHPESGLGPLPNQFSAPPHVQPASSVASPGSAFGSMAPAHAPDL